MTIYDVGDKITVSVVVKDPVTGNPTDDAGTTLTLTDPANVVTSPAPTHGPANSGQYSAVVTAALAGNYLARFVAPTVGFADAQQFYVQPSGFRIVSLTDAKNHINKTGNYTGDDNELAGFIEVAGELVDMFAGPTVNRTVTEYHSGGLPQIFLTQWPVVSVTSVKETWPNGPSYTLNQQSDIGVGSSTGYDFTFDPEDGSITRRVNFGTYAFPPGIDNIKCVYVQGRPQPWPARIRMGALDEISFLWRTSQTGRGAGRPAGVAAEPTIDVAGYGAVPIRVVQLLSSAKAPLAGA